MGDRVLRLERVLLALFVASGFAGLIYQAIWSHYLGLTLGHAAYAQTLVLAIFMGGMAVGAWLVSRRGVNWRRLILAYAVVEIVIGLAGLAFHPAFLGYMALSQDIVYPALDSEAGIRAWQWGSAALLIAPQSILLGMTFPLMSGGYLRVAPRADGEILGGLYFSNSIGAAFGALFATFVLLPWIGMPGAVVVAGIINLAVGLLAWRVSRRPDAQPDARSTAASDPAPVAAGAPAKGFFRTMLFAAGLTGATSFVYEIGWVRMLNQALGTTVHSFELMLSAFILGLAFGGLWVRRRSSRIVDPVATAGWAQIWMGLAALVSLPVFAQSFHWVAALMGVLPRTEAGYAGFVAGSALISIAVMFPAAFFAGMTLPLLTMASLRKGSGEAGIGRVYAVNTLGAILGVGLAVHVLIPMLGVHLAVTLAALADLALGVYLVRWLAEGDGSPRTLPAALSLTLVVLAGSLVLGRADPRMLASGVFRTGTASLDSDVAVPFLRDGKTATVAVVGYEGLRNITTNGKPDSSLNLDMQGEPALDEITMILAGALPLALHEDPGQIGVIGWGTGLTTHTLMGSPVVRRVDTVEIERAMVDGSRLLASRVHRAFDDPRAKLHIDDARTFFSAGRKRYDVIMSMPPNPWVSGVASLFTQEFYGFLDTHLEPGGMLVQWVHTYELDNGLLTRMLAALDSRFTHVEVFLAGPGNLLLVGSQSPLPPLRYPATEGSPLAHELERVGLGSLADFQLRHIGDRRLLKALVVLTGVPPHNDFHPVVSLGAPRSRFMRVNADWPATLEAIGLPVLELQAGRRPFRAQELSSRGRIDPTPERIHDALAVRTQLLGLSGGGEIAGDGLRLAMEDLAGHPGGGSGSQETLAWLAALGHVAESTLSALSAQESEGVWIDAGWTGGWEADPQVAAVLAAYEAAAKRDAGAMLTSGVAALDILQADATPGLVREHMLVIARLGALATGDPATSVGLEDRFGRGIPATPGYAYGFVRAYLSAAAEVAIPSPAS